MFPLIYIVQIYIYFCWTFISGAYHCACLLHDFKRIIFFCFVINWSKLVGTNARHSEACTVFIFLYWCQRSVYSGLFMAIKSLVTCREMLCWNSTILSIFYFLKCNISFLFIFHCDIQREDIFIVFIHVILKKKFCTE